MRRIPLHWIVVILLLLAAAAILGGSFLRDVSPDALIIGWGSGFAFACLAAFAASRLFGGDGNE